MFIRSFRRVYFLPKFRTVEGIFSSARYSTDSNDTDLRKTPHSIGDILRTKHDRGRWLHVGRDSTVFDAVKKMADEKVGCMLILDSSSRSNGRESDIVGIVSERDYLTKVAVLGRSSKVGSRGVVVVVVVVVVMYIYGYQPPSIAACNMQDTKVTDIMTPVEKMKFVSPNQPIIEAMELMCKKNIRHLPIIENGHMQGMLSIRDVTEALLAEKKSEMEQMSDYISGNY